MNNRFKSLILYNYKKIDYRIILILSIILFWIICYTYRSFIYLNGKNINELNMWGFYSFATLDDNLLFSILQFFNLYFVFNCFQNNESSLFLKMRINNSTKWFTSKIISIFFFNLITVIIILFIVMILGATLFGVGSGWNSLNRPWTMYYTPVEVFIFSVIIYTCLTTVIGEFMGFFITKINNRKICAIGYIVYIIVDRVISTFSSNLINNLKYASFSMYTNFSGLKFINDDTNSINNISVTSAVIVPIVLMVLIYIILIYLYRTRKINWVKL